MISKQDLINYIKKQNLAVVATVSQEGKSESAVVEFGCNDKLEIIFDAFENSRKIQNLRGNPNASLVIGWDKNTTVQYEGLIEFSTDEQLLNLKEIYFTKTPEARKWEKTPGIIFVKVVPKWIKFTDLNKHPWDISEFNF